MKWISASLLACVASVAVHGAVAELNVADGSIESPDGMFVGRDFTIVDGFKLELLHVTNLSTEGQWVALTWDNKHRLIVPAYNSDKLARLTIPPIGSDAPVQVEMLTTTPVAAAEGALYAFDSLYINANRSNTMRSGMYRLRDTNGDDQYDETRVIRNRQGSGDHGTHTLQLTPDGKMITMISGNATYPTEVNRSRVPEIWGEDNLVMRMDLSPPGFHRAPEATLVNFSPDGSDVELYAIGMRNPVSMAYNKDGELFVYDADEEPNMGFNVGYRPTDILHVLSGNDGGWRAGTKVHPYYQFDFYAPIGVVGSGSPVGSAFGIGTKFPARYQDAFFVADWSFGNLWAVYITPQGSSYKAVPMPFVSGRPFPVSGIIPNREDGSLLVMTTGTQLYRISYVGPEDTSPSPPDTLYKPMRDIRHTLEAFHGRQDPRAVDTVWPYLGDQDRAIRYAARVALEWQNPASWRDRALAETNPRRATAAIAALARVTAPDEYHTVPGSNVVRDKGLESRMLATLDRIDWDTLNYQEKLDLLRAYELVMIRLGRPAEADGQRLIARFDPYLPAKQQELNKELSEVLVYLQAPSAAEKLMALLQNAPSEPYYGIQEWINPQQRQRQDRGTVTGANIGISQAQIARQDEQIFYAQLLRTLTNGWTPELRRAYMNYFVTAPESYTGNLSGLQIVRNDAISQIPEADRTALQDLIDTPMPNGLGRGGLGGGGGFGGRGGTGTPGLAAPAQSLYVPPGGANRAFNDIEVTALTRFDESMQKEVSDQAAAADALAQTTFALPANSTAIQARVNALGDAELALALARADGYGRLKSQLNMTADRIPVLIQAINNKGGRGIFLGGGGGFPGGGAAPAGRGN